MASKQQTETFTSGATRSASAEKVDYEGFLSSRVLEAYGRFMHFHRELPDGTLRASDNWQKGIPLNNYMKSGWRHFMAWWLWHRLGPSPYHDIPRARETIVWALCALIFNVSGYLHELLDDPDLLDECEGLEKAWREEDRK
jgi:hypothetical protein